VRKEWINREIDGRKILKEKNIDERRMRKKREEKRRKRIKIVFEEKGKRDKKRKRK